MGRRTARLWLLGFCAVAGVAVVVTFTAVLIRGRTLREEHAAPGPPSSVDAWPDGAVVLTTTKALPGAGLLDTGAFLVSPEQGDYSYWSPLSKVCRGQCNVAAGKDRIYVAENPRELTVFASDGARSEISLPQEYPLDPGVPITVSWDGSTVVYGYRRPQGWAPPPTEDPRERERSVGMVALDIAQQRISRFDAPSDAIDVSAVAVSPDGATVAYVIAPSIFMVPSGARPGGRRGAHRLGMPGQRGLERVTVLELRWSPDGAHLVAIVKLGGETSEAASEVWLFDAESLSPARVPIPSHVEDRERLGTVRGPISVAVAPSEPRLVVLSDVDRGCVYARDLGMTCDYSLYSVNFDGSGWRRVSERIQSGGDVSWLR